MEKHCLDCDTIINGRSDKKFCSDQCRTSYNNKIKIEVASSLKVINKILKQNRGILEKLCVNGKAKINKIKLVQHGFNFTYFTHLYETQKGQTYKFCYEFGYLALEQDWFLLVKRTDTN